MPRIIVNDAVSAGAGDVPIRVNSGDRTFRLRASRVNASIVDNLKGRAQDLLLIAAAVFATDARIKRGGKGRADLGERWWRDLHFVMPVLDVPFWQRHAPQLASTLQCLTEDRFTFEFVQRQLVPRRQLAITLPGGVPGFDEVVLFSGGLDSLTGAFECLVAEPSKKVLLVTHRSAEKNTGIQSALADELIERFGERVHWVPVLGTLVDGEAAETTQRSRSFLYAALGYAAASLVGCRRIRFYENGIVSVNLPINRAVVGTMATRTTHPLFLARLRRLLTAIANATIAVDNPYQQMTKTEVVERLVRLGGANLIAKTTSCSSVRRRTEVHPHCGACSQCLDRRFAVLAADVTAHDPADGYKVELWQGPRDQDLTRTMAIDWTRHALRLAGMSFQEFTTHFAKELADVAASSREGGADVSVSNTFDLHRRHGEAVRRVVMQGLSDHGRSVIDRLVPANSLLAAILLESIRREPEPALLRHDGEASAPGVEFLSSPIRSGEAIFPLRLHLVAGADPARLWVAGLGVLEGAHLSLVGTLKPYHEEDLSEPLEPSRHRYIATKKLGNPNTVRQHASRCRTAVSNACATRAITAPTEDPLVQSKTHHGFRLDPEVRFIEDIADMPEWVG